jgi:hypothetical protein
MSPAEALAGRLVTVCPQDGSPVGGERYWSVRVAGRGVQNVTAEAGARALASAWRVALASALTECLPGGKEGRDLDPETVARARELARDLEGHASLRVPVALELAALAPRLLAALDAACRDRDAAEGALCDLLADEGRPLVERGRAEEREEVFRALGRRARQAREKREGAGDRRDWDGVTAAQGEEECVAALAREMGGRGPAPEPLPPARLRARVGAMEGVLRRLVAWAEEDRADAEQWAGIGALADAAREALGEGGHAEP